MSSRHALFLDFDIKAQPDDITCGPTCLHALYQYYNDSISLKGVINEVKSLKTGGTLAVMLGNHALQRGYGAHIYTYNLTIFDPSWFSLSSKKNGTKPEETNALQVSEQTPSGGIQSVYQVPGSRRKDSSAGVGRVAD